MAETSGSEDENQSIAAFVEKKQSAEASSSSSDDGECLADLMKKPNNKSEDKASSSSSSDDEELLSDLIDKKGAAGKDEEDAESSSSSSDSDGDNVSLATLAANIKATKSKSKPKKKRKATSKKRKAPARKKAKSGSKKKETKKATKCHTAPVPAGIRRIDRSAGVLLKPQLVGAVLVRWQYALEWPILRDGMTETPAKKGYIPLRGFEGVLVGVVGDETGKMIDYRDHSKSPSFNNLIQRKSTELQGLVETAIAKQIEILTKEKRTDNSVLIKNLRAELVGVKKVAATKSDKQWNKHGW